MGRPRPDRPPGSIPSLSDEAIKAGRSPLLDDMLRDPLTPLPEGWSAPRVGGSLAATASPPDAAAAGPPATRPDQRTALSARPAAPAEAVTPEALLAARRRVHLRRQVLAAVIAISLVLIALAVRLSEWMTGPT